jgi:predicted nucleic acid-binding protein
MALLLTIDASVFVAACHRREPGYAASRTLWEGLRSSSIPLIEPAILPVEVASALRRTGHGAKEAGEYAATILALPHLTVVTVDRRFSRRAIAVATQHKLRGADSLYVATAIQYGARLVTLDEEQLRRAPSTVQACEPQDISRLLPSA